MLPTDPEPRLPPIAREDYTDDIRAFMAKWTGGPFQNADFNPVLRTFAHHPKLADLFSQFNIHLLSTSTLPVRERQIAIMRTAWLCDAAYMWSSHLNTSMRCGLEPELFRPIQVGERDPYFTDFERAVIRATEDLVRDHKVSEANWAILAGEWNEQQLLDFLFTVGAYVLTAGVMRSTGVQRDTDLLELAERFGSPEPG